jgi:hypothetical protein
MIVQSATPLALEAAPLADVLCAKLLSALRRFAAWRESGGSTEEPNWRHHFLEWQETSEDGRRLAAEVAALDRQLDQAPDGRTRRRLDGLFRLNGPERDLLDCALALAANPALSDRIAMLGGSRVGCLSERLIIELFAHPAQPILRPSSPLAIWSLVEQGPSHALAGPVLAADPDVAAAAFGRPGLDRRLAECAESVTPLDLPISAWPVAETAAAIGRLIDMKQSVRVLLTAPTGSGRVQFAAAVAEQLGTRLLRIGGEAAGDDADLYMRAQRLALITGHGLYWEQPPRAWSPQVASTPVQFVAVETGSASAAPGLVDLPILFPSLSAADKRTVWSACGPGLPPIDGKAAERTLAGARLSDLIAAAGHRPVDCAAACACIRASARARLERDAQLLEQPYDWSDLVLPARQRVLIDTMVAEMRARDRLLASGDRRAKYGGLGQSILFHGPPGTGKTMAAQVLARELQVDLVRVDCASTISKFIGETAKNLRSIFSHVQGTGALLLFDEADALFARRTETKDALDRHANADTNYLLQLIEGFDGAAILTTNKKENIDPAFIRRIRHMVDFGSPGLAERRLLWRRHIETLSDDALAETRLASWCERLAGLDLSPAQIKGAALSAAFVRDSQHRPVPRLEDLVVGIERELAKDGRALDRRVRAELAADG